ncbi:molybdopterin-guanine dinucleotide biosynthesis protein B [Chakrabartyella piscis]|uniref:molybdopterin-guanine dinucleotide biosynthesis protein B n=1 Tax=Chakrabartyella piscis TaxID=2918914 RepID=UPI002958D64A|nr:molybdopterin-guanine dinucleotide biosynthesis protein B [Chakrabartyella piscis]
MDKQWGIVVLAGGMGKRMGNQCKASLQLGGKSFLQRLEQESAEFPTKLLSTSNKSLVEGTSFQMVEDVFVGKGPLAGIHAALQKTDTDGLMVIPCDMPFFTKELAHWLLEQYSGEDAVVCFGSDGRLHPLCGLYTKKCLSKIEEALENNHVKLTELLTEINTKIVCVPKELFPPELFLNVNDIATWKKARAKVEQIPTYCFVAASGTGKTTFLEKLIVELKERQVRVAMVKHDAHAYYMDTEGKDTWRFSQAGADTVVFSSSKQLAHLQAPRTELSDVLETIRDVDLILVEGYKMGAYPKFCIARRGIPMIEQASLENCIGLISDMKIEFTGKRFGLEDVSKVADFILERESWKG